MIMHLGNGFYARAGVIQRIPDFFGFCTPGLYAKQADNRSQAVLDTMAHLARQQFLMIERLLKVGVGLLALDGNAKQAGKARKEVCVRLVKLAGVGAIDFQNAEGLIALRSPFYQHVELPA